MQTAVTQSLYQYWTKLRGDRAAPGRSELEPGDIRAILGDVFILEALDRATYRFRLAGTRLCAAYGRELRGRNFLDFWIGEDREKVACLLAAVVDDGAAAVLDLRAQTQKAHAVMVETMLLPLSHAGPLHNRVLGSFAPVDHPFWLGRQPLVRQPLDGLRLIWPDETPRFLARAAEPAPPRTPVAPPRAPDAGRRFGHLTVFDGGRVGLRRSGGSPRSGGSGG